MTLAQLIKISQMRYIFLFCLAFLISCSKDDVATTATYVAIPLEIETPSNFPEVVYNTDSNPITQAGFELGKKLFYEGKLSANNAISCAECHEQAFAFTHHEHTVSHGVNDAEGIRNSQPIQNLAFYNKFMWDGASEHLDLQPIIPITSDLEMGESLANVIDKLSAEEAYQNLFTKAFENGNINSENMLKALSQFMLVMTSANSKYDKYVRNEDNVTLTTIELDGLSTFQNKCASCHATDLFTDQSYRNTGLFVNPRLNDQGRYSITEEDADLYKFRVPSLRNAEVSNPYMHDGRFATLEAVLDFYDSGVTQNHNNLDPLLIQEDGSLGIPLTDYEKESLIAFIHTLTDTQFLTDERFAEF